MSYKLKKALISIFFLFLFLSLAITLLEFIAQHKNPSWHQSDKVLGWRLKKNFSHTYKMQDYSGKRYLSNFSTDENGFRTYRTSKDFDQTFLIIGDSFVADPYVSNNKMWYAHMLNFLKEKNNKNYAVYSNGGGGYGTLQEFLMLKEILNKKKFDHIILQFCSNDFNNNSYNMEKSKFFYNQYLRRPFYNYKTEKIFYEENILGKLARINLLGDNKIFNKLIYYLSIYKNKKNIITNSNFDDEKKLITIELIKKIRNLIKNQNIYVVNCDGSTQGLNKNWVSMFSQNGFIPLDKPSNFMEKYENKSKDIFFSDGYHYNEKGNKIFGIEVGKAIYPFLK